LAPAPADASPQVQGGAQHAGLGEDFVLLLAACAARLEAAYNEAAGATLGGCLVLPLKSGPTGPAAISPEGEAASTRRFCFNDGIGVPLGADLRPPRPALAAASRAGPGLVRFGSSRDLVDEAIYYFRSNVFFSSFELKGPADLVLVYLTVFMQQCLVRAAGDSAKTKASISSALHALTLTAPAIPGEAGFLVPGPFYAAPAMAEREPMRTYLKQLRVTLVQRLVAIIFDDEDKLSKWWKPFAKRRFMKIE
ncbi:ARPC3, partial [Symbiodinium microadriaticum]